MLPPSCLVPASETVGDGSHEPMLAKEIPLADPELMMDMMQPDEWKELPQSIYGAAMMAAIRSAVKIGKPKSNMDSAIVGFAYYGVSLTVFVAMCLSVFLQAYVLCMSKKFISFPAVLAARKLYDSFHEDAFTDGEFDPEKWQDFDDTEDLCQLPFSQPWFFMSLLVIWTATCWVHLKESYKYAAMWLDLPSPSELPASPFRSPYAHVEVKYKDEPGHTPAHTHKDEQHVTLTHASRCTKFVVMLFIFTPKVTIGMLLWWLGARWLSATPSFEDLVLNAVALAFIVELDELIYHTAVPEDVMKLVEVYRIKVKYAKKPAHDDPEFNTRS